MRMLTLACQQLAWVIAFVSSAIAQTQVDSHTGPFPGYAWWTLAYMLCCLIGIFVVVASDTIATYHVAIVGFLAAGMVMTTSAVNALVYSSNGAREAGAAGFILLSMVAVRSLAEKTIHHLR